MQTGRKLLYTFLGVLISLFGLIIIVMTFGLLGEAAFLGINLGFLIGDFNYTLLGFILFILGIILIAVFTSKKEKEREFGSVTSFSEMGEVRISLKAVESMVLMAARSVKGIREVSTRTESTEQGLIIYLRIKTIPDTPIPGLASELQEKVKTYVQEISGYNVAEVKVLVENIAHEKIQKNVR